MPNRITMIKIAINNECWIGGGEKRTLIYFSAATMGNRMEIS